MYVGDVTVDETLSAFTFASNCRYTGTIVLTALATAVLFHSKFRRVSQSPPNFCVEVDVPHQSFGTDS